MALSIVYSVFPRRVLSAINSGELTTGKLPSPPVSLLSRRRSRWCYCRSAAASPASISPLVTESDSLLVQSPQLVASEYAELNLSYNFCEEVGTIRIRQHVNPLRSSLMVPAEAPNWKEVYKDTSLPLMVDIGCGSGRFLLYLAKRNSESKNYLGLEIRSKLVKRSLYWANELDLRNIHFMYANATVSFERIVSTYPGPLMLVSILCPDPHFKKRHHKRRVLQKPLARSIVDRLAVGGQVFIQSDVFEVALDMRDHFNAMSSELIHIDSIDSNVVCDSQGWVLKNPMGIRTEREIHAESEGSSIYRRIYQKVQR